jgi:hypothetical protein
MRIVARYTKYFDMRCTATTPPPPRKGRRPEAGKTWQWVIRLFSNDNSPAPSRIVTLHSGSCHWRLARLTGL